jgi:hypothetical protein
MDGAIVTAVHDEFRRMGLRGFAGFMDEGACGGWCGRGKDGLDGRFLSPKDQLISGDTYTNKSSI